MYVSNGRLAICVNEAGRMRRDEQIKVRFREDKCSPLVLVLMNILNAFGNAICPIKEDKPRS